jgi:uncharacterized delta-60 repeat protein
MQSAVAAYPGDLDRSFPTESYPYFGALCVAMQLDGKIVAGGDGFATPDSAIRRGPLVRLNSDGSLDSSFNPPLGGTAWSVRIGSDGGCVAGGSFAIPGSPSSSLIVKLLPDGRLDPGFALDVATSGTVGSVAIQSDGRILIGGPVLRIGGRLYNGVARVNSDGSADANFDPGSGIIPPAGGGRSYLIYALEVDEHDRILVGGFIGSADGVPCPGVVRLLPNGRPDPSFAPDLLSGSAVRSLKVLGDGNILVGGFLRRNDQTNAVLRLTSDGRIDPTFHSPSEIIASDSHLKEMDVQPDGKILVAGDPGLTTTSLGSLVRLLPDGQIDKTFGMFSLAPLEASILEIEVNPAGDIVAIGNWLEIYGVRTPWIIRFRGGDLPQMLPHMASATTVVQATAGALLTLSPVVGGNPSPSFQWYFNGQFIPGGTEPILQVRGMTSTSSGSYTLVSSNALGSLTSKVAQIFAPSVSSEPGSSISDFVPAAPLGNVQAVLEQPGCGLLVARLSLSRLKSDGSKDPSFRELNIAPGSFTALALTRTGSILAGGLLPSVGGAPSRTLVKLTPDGEQVPDFHPLADVRIPPKVLAVDSQDRIYVARAALTGFSLLRLLPNGEPDDSFEPVTIWAGTINCLMIQSLDRLVVAGQFNGWKGIAAQNMVRLLSTGEVDPTFQAVPGADGEILTIQGTADGRLLWGGRFQNLSGHPAKFLGRTDADGVFDPTLVSGDALGHISHITVASTGDILAGHDLSKPPAVGPKTLLSRYKQNGTLDPTFEISIPISSKAVRCGLLTACGDWVVGGEFREIGGISRFGLSKIRLSGQATSAAVIRLEPISTNLPAGQSALLGVIADGGALRYQWLADKIPLAGQTLPTILVRASAPEEFHDYQVVLSNRVGVVTSAVARVTTLDPVPAFVVNPTSQAVAEGSNVRFTVDVTSGSSTRLQWVRDGIVLPGETNRILLLPEVSMSDVGVYLARSFSNGGTATSTPAQLTVLPRLSFNEVLNTRDWNWGSSSDWSWVPDLVQSWNADGAARSGSVPATGGKTVLTTQVYGPGELTFRWKTSTQTMTHQLAFSANGQAPFMTLTGQTPWEEVRVPIAHGFATLAWVYEELALEPQDVDRGWIDGVSFQPAVPSVPALLKIPQATTVEPGTALKLSVFAEGTLPLRYQWFRNGIPVPGATQANLWLESVDTSSAGTYSVTVSNDFGESRSQAAWIGVRGGPPALSLPERAVGLGTFKFVLQGTENQLYRIEYSTDLGSWIFLKEVRSTAAAILVEAGPPSTAPHHFYRAVAVEE